MLDLAAVVHSFEQFPIFHLIPLFFFYHICIISQGHYSQLRARVLFIVSSMTCLLGLEGNLICPIQMSIISGRSRLEDCIARSHISYVISVIVAYGPYCSCLFFFGGVLFSDPYPAQVVLLLVLFLQYFYWNDMHCLNCVLVHFSLSDPHGVQLDSARHGDARVVSCMLWRS